MAKSYDDYGPGTMVGVEFETVVVHKDMLEISEKDGQTIGHWLDGLIEGFRRDESKNPEKLVTVKIDLRNLT